MFNMLDVFEEAEAVLVEVKDDGELLATRLVAHNYCERLVLEDIEIPDGTPPLIMATKRLRRLALNCIPALSPLITMSPPQITGLLDGVATANVIEGVGPAVSGFAYALADMSFSTLHVLGLLSDQQLECVVCHINNAVSRVSEAKRDLAHGQVEHEQYQCMQALRDLAAILSDINGFVGDALELNSVQQCGLSDFRLDLLGLHPAAGATDAASQAKQAKKVKK